MDLIKPLVLLVAIAAVAPFTRAHGEAEHAPRANKPAAIEEHAWGREGDAASATRTISVDMADNMRFQPGTVTVKRGDTIRFVVKNTGKVMHEMVIGTREELERHADIMKKYPDMEHEEPYMAHVSPGKTEEIVWTFTKPGTFMYGCLIPGHWEAGMKGTIVVAAN